MIAGHSFSNDEPKGGTLLVTSSCFDHFGFEDFDLARLKTQYPKICPVRSCSAAPVSATIGKHERSFCQKHGILLHSRTFVYWNGPQQRTEARLRNFTIRPDLARSVAIGSIAKAESHRLGFEMSEDALSWNVFVGLAMAGKLRDTVRWLTGRSIAAEPSLYLWGELIDVHGLDRHRFEPLDVVRLRLERDIGRFKTEPDVMLVDGDLVICIEAKFGSGNPLAHGGAAPAGDKPSDREGLLQRYVDKAGADVRQMIDRAATKGILHSQLLRNIVFAAEMSSSCDWHVVNLVSSTQWQLHGSSKTSSFLDPSNDVRSYLHHDCKSRFTFRTWEGLYKALIRDDLELAQLGKYFRTKSAHYVSAFGVA